MIPRHAAARSAGARPRFTTRDVSQNQHPTGGFRRDRNAGVITTKEWEEVMEEHKEGGRSFRKFWYCAVLAIILVIMYAKYDVEYNITPQLTDGEYFDGDGEAQVTEDPEADKYFELLKVSKNKHEENEKLSKAEQAKQRRLENWRQKQAVKASFKEHMEGYGQLVHCGRSCSNDHKQMEIAYNALTSKVDRDFYKVMKVGESKAGMSRNDLRKKYEEMKEEIEKTEPEGSDEKQMALEELKDSFEVLSNPETRAYYNLYGRKPPEWMRKTSARHGGWGQDLALRTFKNRLILEWLSYLDSYWVDVGLLALIFLVVYLIPVGHQLPMIIDKAKEIEEHYARMDELQAQAGNKYD